MTTSHQILLRGQEISYQYMTSDRRSLSIEIKGGELIVRAPYRMPVAEAETFLRSKQNWILTKLKEQQQKALRAPKEADALPETVRTALKKRYSEDARRVLTERVAYYQQFTGGTYHKITIREQKTRWGSCSSKGTLSFHWKLILAPPLVLDYVVVHELCHLTHMNHSKAFWDLVASVMPDYKIRRKWLKTHGDELSKTYTPLPW